MLVSKGDLKAVKWEGHCEKQLVPQTVQQEFPYDWAAPPLEKAEEELRNARVLLSHSHYYTQADSQKSATVN